MGFPPSVRPVSTRHGVFPRSTGEIRLHVSDTPYGALTRHPGVILGQLGGNPDWRPVRKQRLPRTAP